MCRNDGTVSVDWRRRVGRPGQVATAGSAHDNDVAGAGREGKGGGIASGNRLWRIGADAATGIRTRRDGERESGGCRQRDHKRQQIARAFACERRLLLTTYCVFLLIWLGTVRIVHGNSPL